ncbi:uncharacterized protein LDX57_008535 [Aspergillus melleus]|uniref:uncharacterized protein n=1 Tax=Aspergillus melleus TaxID=138277 RepID=UPI001E8E0506|nr:uncharacterized protein LDX57_008535 [Aspergillus melleus]KAH8430871.1 hypothetical protein LDX57_008535 [Aspergillus melleus]
MLRTAGFGSKTVEDQDKDNDSQTVAVEDDDDHDHDDDDDHHHHHHHQTARAEEKERVREIAVAKLCAMLGRRQRQLTHTSLDDWVETMQQPGLQQGKAKAATVQTALSFEPEKRKNPPRSDTREPKRLKVREEAVAKSEESQLQELKIKKLKLSQSKPPTAESAIKPETPVNLSDDDREERQLRSRERNRD